MAIHAASSLLTFWLALVGLAHGSSLGASCPADEATVFALTYGFPLLAFQKGYGPVLTSPSYAVNEVLASKNLVTPQETRVVRPSVETLYSTVLYDISRRDLEVSLLTPPDSGRYFDIAFYDPYGENYFNLGAVTNSTPGKYLLSPSPSARLSGTLRHGATQGYIGTIYSPSTFGVLLYRVLLRNASSDLPIAQAFQGQFKAQSVPRKGPSSGPPLSSALLSGLSSSLPVALMQGTARFTRALPYGDTRTLPEAAASELARAGINHGAYQQPSCVDLNLDFAEVEKSIRSYVTKPGATISFGNSWVTMNTSLQGMFGSNYLARAFEAEYGSFALVSTQALYPSLNLTLSLQVNESYTFAFSGRPPVEQLGFWSLTVYDTGGFLVANSINRYALGDRSNLTYSNGTLVYNPGGQALSPRVQPGENETFYILLQAASPPANWTSNWLPSPPQGGMFTINLRLYVASKALTDGSYVYPLVSKGAAITMPGGS